MPLLSHRLPLTRYAEPRLGVAAACLLVLALATPRLAAEDPPATNDAVVLSEFIYKEAPYPACHASTIAESEGGLVAAWFGGTHERHTDVAIWVARKEAGDAAWSTAIKVADGRVGDELYPTWNPVLFQPSKGPLLLFYKVGPTPRDWWGMLTKSEDGGRTWSEPQRLPEGMIGPVKNKPIELASGELLCPTSTEDHGWRVHFEFTDNTGTDWRATPAANDPDEIRAIQPSVLVHGDSRLQAIGRTRSRGVFQVWSDDSGETWGEMTTTGLPNPSSGTDAVTLADGRHLLVYNHNPEYKGRSPLNVAISRDGITWKAALVLEDEQSHKAGYSYPAVIQTNDGLVHITYTWRRERIKHVVLDPARLTGAPIIEGRWPASASDANAPAGGDG